MQKVSHVLESIYSDADCHLSAVSLNDGHIFDTIFGDEYIMDIVGALECKFTKSASLFYCILCCKRESHWQLEISILIVDGLGHGGVLFMQYLYVTLLQSS